MGPNAPLGLTDYPICLPQKIKTYTKIEAAETVLLRAIELFLLGEHVSAVILAEAGQQTVRNVCKSREKDITIK